MTESTCLHIQDHESGPIRVVELPWISVRIGRASHCEVRLAGTDLPQELCRLQRRGESWRLLPTSPNSPIFLEGRTPGRPTPHYRLIFPFVSGRIASHYVTTKLSQTGNHTLLLHHIDPTTLKNDLEMKLEVFRNVLHRQYVQNLGHLLCHSGRSRSSPLRIVKLSQSSGI